jgi:hypothetical protein
MLSAEGDAPTSDRRHCYKRLAALLYSSSGAATFLRRRCYNGAAALLQWPERHCNCPAVYIPPVALLESSGGAATVVRRQASMLHGASGAATTTRHLLLQGLSLMLLGSSEAAARVGRRCH